MEESIGILSDHRSSKSVERMNTHIVCTITDCGDELVSHCFDTRIGIGNSEYTSWRSVGTTKDIGNPEGEDCRFACTRTSNHHDWAIDFVDCASLFGIERFVSVVKCGGGRLHMSLSIAETYTNTSRTRRDVNKTIGTDVSLGFLECAECVLAWASDDNRK